MKLFLNKTSPYARMVRILVLEKGISDRVELCWCDPWNDDEALLAENPASKIPVLVCDSGIPISESLLIASYLDNTDTGVRLIPDSRKEEVLHLLGLGLGLMDDAFTEAISQKYLDKSANNSVLSIRRYKSIERLMRRLEEQISLLSKSDISAGDIAVAVALDYLSFRLPSLKTAKNYPVMEAWREKVTRRQSFKSTSFNGCIA